MADNLTADAIYQVCLQAGFNPEQAVTMTAVAMAESGGNPNALAVARNEHSVGLFQINLMAHSNYTAEQLADPLTNAKAAFEVSHGGRDISPWTVTHRDVGARYELFREDALAAATAHGDQGVHGYFDGVAGYGDHHPADVLGELHPDSAHPAADVHAVDGQPVAAHANAATTFVQAALAQQGDSYHLGATPSLNDANPHTFDCSSLVQWAANQAGVHLERTAEAQYLQLKGMGSTMTVEQALKTPGALLFHFPSEPGPGQALGGNAHVAISLGDGRTIEAVGTKWGVREVDVSTFHTGGAHFFTNAAFVPGLAGDVDAQVLHADGTVTNLHPTDAAAVAGTPATAAPLPPPAPAAPAHEVLAPLGGLWRGDPGQVVDAAHPVDPAHPAQVVLQPLTHAGADGHGLPPLPPLGLVTSSTAAATSAPSVGTVGRSLPGLGAAAAADHGAPAPLPSLGHVPDVHATTPIPGLDAHPDVTHAPTAGDHSIQHLIDTHHSVGDHDPMASWATGHELPGEIHLQSFSSGHELPGEIHLHDDTHTIDDHHPHVFDAHDLPHDFHG